MKPTHFSGFLAAVVLCGAALEASAELTQTYTNTFDNTNSVVGWDYWFGNLPGNSGMSWDSTTDAGNNPGSGSLKVAIPWTASGQSQWWYGYFAFDSLDRDITMVGACITNISCDIHIDPSSPLTAAGNFGSIKIGFNPGNVFWTASAVTLPSSASNGWMHVSIPVPANADPGVVSAFCVAMNNSATQTNGSTLFWMDNFALEATLNYTNGFNVAPGPYSGNVGSSTTSWIYWHGVNSASSAMSWDSTTDANGSSASGSLKVSIPWTGGTGNSTGANLSQTMFGTFGNRYSFDNVQMSSASNFQNILCSVHVDPSSPMNAAGNYGVLQIGFVQDVSGTWSGITWPVSSVTLNANASSGWTNIVVPITNTPPGLSDVAGIFMQMLTDPTNGGGLPGTTLLWVDNFGAMAAAPAATPPSFASVGQSGANVILNGINPGGASGLNYVILSSTNLSPPVARWKPVATNLFNSNGTFSFTNAIIPSQPATYFTFTVDVSVTVLSSPSGGSFTVDGTSFTTSQTFNWIPGSSHVIAATSPQSVGTGIQRVWSSWSDGGAMSHVVSPSSGATFTANFTTQYYLTINAGTGGNVSPGSGWNNSGAVVPISTTTNAGYYFSNWTGSGSGSYTGTSSAASVTMNGPITETASFTTNAPANIFVTVQPSLSGCSFTVDGSNFTTAQIFSWFPGSGHVIATTSPQSGGTGIQYAWSGWSDGGAISHVVNPSVGTTYTANFTTQYYLTMSAGTGGGASPASGWNNSGAVIPISAPASAGYTFSSWTGSGSGSYSGTNSSASVTMNGPISETASFTSTPAAASLFTMSTNIGVAPFTVTFTDTSVNNPTSWLWTFGDGSTSTLQNPSYTFTNMWRQLVTLAVTNVYGGSVSTQAVYQSFPCDALYDWTGAQGQVATAASLANSLVAGANAIGTFTTTNHDLPSTNLQGMIFTNLPGMTNGCPVVFSNGVIYSNFNVTNALAYTFTNDHEQYTYHFNSGLNITNLVWVFYESTPLASNLWLSGIDEASISTTRDNPDIGAHWLNRQLGVLGPLLPGTQNNNHTTETDSGYSVTTNIWQLPNKLYRIVWQDNTNGSSQFAVADPVTGAMMGFVTNFATNQVGYKFGAFCNGHISAEVFVANTTCIMGYHDILSINRPLTFSQDLKRSYVWSLVNLNNTQIEKARRMKLSLHLTRILAAAALCATALESSAQLTQPYIGTFDNANSVVGWFYEQGVLPSWSEMAWDSTTDAGANPNSGSLKVSIPWSATGQYEYLFGYLNMDGWVAERNISMQGRFITNIAFDIHVDPSSPIASAGNFGSLQYGFVQYGTASTLTLPLSASNGWMHVSTPIPSNTYPGVVQEFVFKLANAAGQTSGTTLFWIEQSCHWRDRQFYQQL